MAHGEVLDSMRRDGTESIIRVESNTCFQNLLGVELHHINLHLVINLVRHRNNLGSPFEIILNSFGAYFD